MIESAKIKEAISTGLKFIARRSSTDPAIWNHIRLREVPDKKLAVFWWSGTIPLVEVPLELRSNGVASGYLLVSTSRDLPPILEYATDGDPLSTQITQLITPALSRSAIRPTSFRYVFITSTEIYVEIIVGNKRSRPIAIAVPTLQSFALDAAIAADISPSSVFSKAITRAQWENFTPGAPGDKPEVELQNAIPVRYQQNCDKYSSLEACGINVADSKTPCSPNAISGCVAVAWAMLLSAWKRTGYWDTNKIWAGSSCWATEWPSWGSFANPSQCPEVEKTIWQLHQVMSTSADGGTPNDKTFLATGIFRQFGMPWKYTQAFDKPFEFAIGVIQAGQPLLWTANGIWNPVKRASVLLGVPGGVGHAVVAYGYKKADRTLLVALGWGFGFANKRVNYDQYRITNCLYLISKDAKGKGRSPLQVD